MPTRLLCGALVCTFLLSLSAAAQTPDDEASQRPCDKIAYAGFSATQGNADTLSLLLAGDYCRQWTGGRWSADLDANMQRTEGSSAAERVDLYLFRERHHSRNWVTSYFGTAEMDRARGLTSRLFAGVGIGKLQQFAWRKGAYAGLHGGVAYTVTAERQGAELAFPEAWSKLDLAVQLTRETTMTSGFHVFSNLEDASDVRLDVETSIAIQIHRRLSLSTGVTINYDNRPAAGADEFDLATSTVLGITGGDSSRESLSARP
jgi:putative salt-induced outer membrane protein YdiY